MPFCVVATPKVPSSARLMPVHSWLPALLSRVHVLPPSMEMKSGPGAVPATITLPSALTAVAEKGWSGPRYVCSTQVPLLLVQSLPPASAATLCTSACAAVV